MKFRTNSTQRLMSILREMDKFFKLMFLKINVNKIREVDESSNNPTKPGRKYSDLMKWQDNMLKEVGLNVPPEGWKTPDSNPSNEILVTFIKRKPK